jgi:hypothetical protein
MKEFPLSYRFGNILFIHLARVENSRGLERKPEKPLLRKNVSAEFAAFAVRAMIGRFL